MYVSVQVALSDVWEALPNVREWLGGPPRCPEVVSRSSRMAGRPSWMSRSGLEALTNVREWSGGPP